MTNKLTGERSRLRDAAKNYQTALAWYQSNIDNPAALQAWDTATAEFMRVIGNRETDIIADLLNEIDALTNHAGILATGVDHPVAYLCRQNAVTRELFGTSGDWEVNSKLVESDLPVVEIPESDDYEFLPLYTAPQLTPVFIGLDFAGPTPERVSEINRAIEAVKRLNNEMNRWTSCMSYNGSYVGEPEGLFKRNIREIERILDASFRGQSKCN